MHARRTAVLAVAAAAIVCTFTTTSRAQTVRQLTETPGNRVALPVIDDAGAYLFVILSSQQLGDGVHQIGRFDAATGAGELLTDFADGVTEVAPNRLDVDDAGDWMAFVSHGDLTGQNPDRGNEMFVMRSDGTGLAQITNDPSANSGSVDHLAISGDGSKIAFVASTDPLGTNTAHLQNLFAVNRDGTGLVQLTQETNGDGSFWYGFSISDDGQRIAFSHTGDHTGGNADRGWEIFTVESDGSNLTRLTSTVYADGTTFPHVSGPGSKIVFQSAANLTGGNADGTTEIYLMDWAGTNLQQLTSAADDSYSPTITDDESTVVFVSDQSLASQNSDHNYEVWKIQSNGSGMTALTNTTGRYGSAHAQVSGTGGRVAFSNYTYTTPAWRDYVWTSTYDVRAIDTGGSNSHLLSADQVTTHRADLTADGTRVVFMSAADLLGGMATAAARSTASRPTGPVWPR